MQWSWTPLASFSIVPRWIPLATLAAGLAIANLFGAPLLAIAAGTVAGIAAEYVVLQRRVRAALALTTAAAHIQDTDDHPDP